MKKLINKKWMLEKNQIRQYNLKRARIDKNKRIEFLTR